MSRAAPLDMQYEGGGEHHHDAHLHHNRKHPVSSASSTGAAIANATRAVLQAPARMVAYHTKLKKQDKLVLGDMSVQGNIKPLRSLVEPLRVAMDNGAKRALIPIENKRTFLEVSADIVEHVDPIFYGDPKTAAMKGLGLV